MNTVSIGMDLGDKKHHIHVLNENGETIQSCRIDNTSESISSFFSKYLESHVAIEAGPHSPWVSRLLEKQVDKVFVGNPRKLRMIWNSDQKDDMGDAEMLAKSFTI